MAPVPVGMPQMPPHAPSEVGHLRGNRGFTAAAHDALRDSRMRSNVGHATRSVEECLRVAALWRGRPQRNLNAVDDTQLKMGDYFDLAADLYQLPRPPRIARDTAGDQLPLMLLSFMSESRRLANRRMTFMSW